MRGAFHLVIFVTHGFFYFKYDDDNLLLPFESLKSSLLTPFKDLVHFKT